MSVNTQCDYCPAIKCNFLQEKEWISIPGRWGVTTQCGGCQDKEAAKMQKYRMDRMRVELGLSALVPPNAKDQPTPQEPPNKQ